MKTMLEEWMDMNMWVAFDIDGHMDDLDQPTWDVYNPLFATRNEKERLAKLTNKWYDTLKESKHFQNLGMDQQGELCVYAAKLEIQKYKDETISQ